MARTPLSIAVPLDGTDHELGVKQLQKYVSLKPTIRSQYRRFRGPFLEYVTLDDLQRGPRSWNLFLHGDPNAKKPRHDVYTVPGSVVALCERMDENLVFYTVNYLTVMLVATVMVLGLFRGVVVAGLALSYLWLHDPDRYFPEPWEQFRGVTVQYLYPSVCLLLALLTSLGTRLTTGILLGLFLTLLHAGSHRSISEMRYVRQKGVVRWIRRGRAPLEGASLLWTDLQRYRQEAWDECVLWLRWKYLHFRDVLGLMRLTVMMKWNKRVNEQSVSLVVNRS